MNATRTSLAHRLTIRLVLLQLVTLLAFALCVPLLQVLSGQTDLHGPDPKIGDDIATALQRSDDRVALVAGAPFQALLAEAPDLWFVAVDAQGNRFDFGAVPPTIADAVQSFALLQSASFGGAALLVTEQAAWGEVRLVFGNGPVVGPWRALARSAVEKLIPLAVILLVLAGVTILAVPRLIGTALAGMHRAVHRARMIDIDRRGTRLPNDDVPAEIGALVDAVNEALKRIDDGYERQQRFLADAAHELRTPIAILQNRMELLARGDLDFTQCADRLRLDVQRVANLAEQLLDLQRIDHDEASFGRVNLVAIARDVVSDLAPLAIEAGYDPQLTIEGHPTPVLGDRPAIERALINLVQNAVSHGGNRGAIRVHVETGSILVFDDGWGIEVAQRELIFEPFHRLHPRDRGAGLGLSLVREIMARHHGSVEVRESPSGGACFVLHFNAADPVGLEHFPGDARQAVAA